MMPNTLSSHRTTARSTSDEVLPPPVKSSRPHPWEMLLHPLRTLGFVNALRTDPRISWLRKLLYIVPMAVLLLALLLPESLIAAFVAAALPVLGPVVDIPADVAINWAFIGIAAYGLLGVLPRAIVSEHHAQVFHPGRVARQRRS